MAGQKTISSSFTVSVQEKGDTGAQGPQGNDGQNSIRIDLSNENDSMLYSSSKGLVSGNVTSTAYLYDGMTDVSTSATWSVSASGCTISSGNSRNIVVTGMTAVAGTVTVSATYKSVTRSTQLTLKKIVDGDKYELVISPNSIPYNSTTDNPATSTLSIQIWKTTCDNVRALSAPPTGYSVYANGTALTASSTGTYSHTTDNSAITEVLVKIAKSASSSDCLDSETIPVNKSANGDKGDSAAQAYADPDNFVVLCNTSGSVISSTSQVVAFSMKVGNNAATNVNYTAPSSLPTGVSVSGSTPESATITVGTTATASGLKSGVTFTIGGTYGGKTYSVPVTVAIIGAVKGATGESITGHTGRFFYYAGEWSSSRIYYFEKNQAPYVKASNGSFYMLDYAAHPDIQASDTTRQVDAEFNPIYHAGGDPWSLMSSEQQYYIAKAFFGEYAQFGSFIINGDWMISTQGTMNGVESTSYTYFDPLFAGGAINCLVKSVQISSGTTTQISSNFNLLGGKDYDFNVTAYGLGANTTLTVTIRRKSGSSWTLVHTFENWTGTTKSMKLATLSSVTAGEYAFFAYASSSGAIIAPVNVSTINAFIPTFAVDGLTGKAYMRNAQVSGQITAEGLVTSNGSFSTEISAGVTTWRSIANPLAYISIGADSDGMFFKMTDKNGALLWDISSGGNGKITGAGGGTYDQLNYKKITNSGTTSTPKFSISEFGYVTDEDTTPYYLYHGQYSMSGNTKTWATINNISESTVDQCVYTSKNADGTSPSSTGYGLTKILDGYYTPVNNGSFMMNADGTYTLKVYRYVSGKQYGNVILYSFNM